MKRDFLRNFKVGDQELSKEIIDAIMAENGRDIEAAKAPYADYEAIKEQLKTAQDGLKAFEQVDVTELQGKIKALQDDLSKKDSEWQKKVDAMAFDGRLKDAITAAKGKNAKAIAALLDVDTLRASKNQESDIRAALEAVKKDNDYLFGADRPAGYAAGTGGAGRGGKYSPEEAAIRAAAPAQDPGGGGRPGIKQADHPVHTVSTASPRRIWPPISAPATSTATASPWRPLPGGTRCRRPSSWLRPRPSWRRSSSSS